MEQHSGPPRVNIGEVLIHRGQAKYHQLEFLLELQKSNRIQGKKIAIGELLVSHRVVTSLALTEALAAQEEMPGESITLILNAMRDFPSTLTKVYAK